MKSGMKIYVVFTLFGFLMGCQTTKNLPIVEQMRHNQETRETVETLANTIAGQEVKAKYCPVDGERYAPSVKICPKHQVELKTLE